MRTGFLGWLALSVAGVAACGSAETGSAVRSTSQRDVALPAQAPAVEIASPLELRNLRAQAIARRSQRTARSDSASAFTAVPAELVPTSVVAAPALTLVRPTDWVAAPAPGTALERTNEHELPPGETVSVIPASSGPTIGSEPDEMPLSPGRINARGKGARSDHGRGPGITTAPRPDFR